MVICSVLLACDFVATLLKWNRRQNVIAFCDAATAFDHSKHDSVSQLNAGYGMSGRDFQVYLYKADYEEADEHREWLPLEADNYKIPKYKDAIVAECQWFPFVPWTKKEISLPEEDAAATSTSPRLLASKEEEDMQRTRQILKRWREDRERREFFGGQTLVERTADALPVMLDALHGEFQV